MCGIVCAFDIKQPVQALRPQGQSAAEPQPVILTFEIIYGHAVKARARLSMKGETSLSLDEMRRELRQGGRALGGRP